MPYNNPFAKYDENFKALQREDQKAKNNNQLVGRYIAEPYADGKAYYRITKVNKKTVRIEVVTEIGDDWVIPYWGEVASIDRAYAENSVAYRDRLAKAFAERKIS